MPYLHHVLMESIKIETSSENIWSFQFFPLLSFLGLDMRNLLPGICACKIPNCQLMKLAYQNLCHCPIVIIRSLHNIFPHPFLSSPYPSPFSFRGLYDKSVDSKCTLLVLHILIMVTLQVMKYTCKINPWYKTKCISRYWEFSVGRQTSSRAGGGYYDKMVMTALTLPTTPELFIGLVQAIWWQNLQILLKITPGTRPR